MQEIYAGFPDYEAAIGFEEQYKYWHNLSSRHSGGRIDFMTLVGFLYLRIGDAYQELEFRFVKADYPEEQKKTFLESLKP
jgi:hypothetical protein